MNPQDPTQRMRKILARLPQYNEKILSPDEIFTMWPELPLAVAELSKLLDEVRIDELNRKMTLHVELLSSKDFKAGFSEALDQIDAANDIRIKALQQPNKSQETGE